MCQPMGLFEIILAVTAILFVLYTIGAVIVGLVIDLGDKKKPGSGQCADNFMVRAGRRAWTERGRDGLTDGFRVTFIAIAIIIYIIWDAIF